MEKVKSSVERYLFYVVLDERTQTTGVILFNQFKTSDLKMRNAQKKEECPEDK